MYSRPGFAEFGTDLRGRVLPEHPCELLQLNRKAFHCSLGVDPEVVVAFSANMKVLEFLPLGLFGQGDNIFDKPFSLTMNPAPVRENRRLISCHT